MKKISLLSMLLVCAFCFGQIREEISINELISGTLLYTNKKNNENLIVIIAGSGPTDRDGNQTNLKNNSLKFLAEGIVNHKNDVFNFDKRFFAQIKSGKFDEKTLLFTDMIVDVENIVTYYKDKKKYKKIIIAGHSEGSLVGMLASKKNVNAFISLAGAGKPANEIIEEQIAKQAPTMLPEIKEIFIKLKKGETFENKNPMLASLFRESVQPYLISWIKYNPQTEIQKLNIPTLIVNGTKDIQVGIADANLLKLAKPDAEIQIIENMNHVLKEIIGDQNDNMASYTNPDLPISKIVLEKVNNFINNL